MAEASPFARAARVREVTVAADDGQLGRVRDFIVEVCEEAGFSARETSNAKLAVDEACTNIIKHAYLGRDDGTIVVHVEMLAGQMTISLRDNGKRFDFAGVQDPDLDQYVETGRKGGLGVYLINRLMDTVEYRGSDGGNELVMTKRSQAAISAGMFPSQRPLRGTLRYKFTMRAAGGLLALMLVVWAFVIFRQTGDIDTQRAGKWSERLRLAESIAQRSVDLLLQPDEFSVVQTNLSSELTRLVETDAGVAWVRVVTADGQIASSGNVDEMFTSYSDPGGKVLLRDGDRVVWRQESDGDRDVRDIEVSVRVAGPDGATPLKLGAVHLGLVEGVVEAGVEDNRLYTTVLLLALFGVGVLLIMGLVRVFVRPIQVLTDGVRAIGDGTLDTKLDIGGPAEIGAIASVFNEITDKFKKAQTSILEQEKMQKEMEVAKQIQQSLLPRHKPDASGYDIATLYQAAAEVGGDYYDFVQVDDDTIGVVVADVSGKGVPGSLVMTMIRTALRMEARGNKNASDVMAKMNAFVTDDMKKGMFVTMFYTILDSQNRIISYASAGHNPMILFRHETGETFFLNPKGFPVGISLPDEELFRKSISLEKIKLKKDDMLVIYTDGVTEAMNQRREQFGEERLLSVIRENGNLSPEDFMARLDTEIKKFTAGYPQNDDITVVAVKEKLAADDVLFGIRKKLLQLVDVEGMSVKDACRQMRVSAATYYRYKKRVEMLGERGLHDKVMRQDVALKRLSTEARKGLLAIIAGHPEYGARRLTEEYNEHRGDAPEISERMVYEELKRLSLNTREMRIDYLKRNRLYQGDEVAPAREAVDAFLDEISRAADDEAAVEDDTPVGEVSEDDGIQFEHASGVGIGVEERGDIAVLRVSGHLDSVSSSVLERRIHELIRAETVKLVVDLADVTYISSGGWGIFTGEVRTLRQEGGDIVLTGMTSEVYDVYELLGFADVLRAVNTVDDAVEFLSLAVEERLSVPIGVSDRVEDVNDSVFDGGGEPVIEWESLRIAATTVGEAGDIAVLSLGGIIDTVSAERLRDALERVIASGRRKVVVDMSQVEYVSSGGWGTFTERLREVRRGGGDIKLFGMDPDVYYVFTMLGFNIVLASFDILVEAIEDFREGGGGVRHLVDRPDADRFANAAQLVDASGPPALGKVPAFGPEDEYTPVVPPLPLAGTQHIVEWEVTGDGIRVGTLHGPMEAAAVEALSYTLAGQLAQRPAIILFDLADVPYISSTGWGQFARCVEACRPWRGGVAICGLSPALHEIYALLEFRAFLPAFLDRAEALVAMRGDGPAVRAVAPTAGMKPRGSTPDRAPDEDETDVDAVLGTYGSQPLAPEAVPGPGGPGIERWPGQKRSEPPRRDVEPAIPEAEREGIDVDVGESAVADRNIGRDAKLRDMGWEKYGEKLRGHKTPDEDGGNGDDA